MRKLILTIWILGVGLISVAPIMVNHDRTPDISASFQFAPTAYAQTAPATGSDECNPFESEELCIPKPSTLPGPTASSQNKTYLRDVLLVTITRTLISLVGGIAFLFFIIGGVQFLTVYGNEESLTSAKKTVTWSVIGFLIAAFAYAIVSIIGSIEL